MTVDDAIHARNELLQISDELRRAEQNLRTAKIRRRWSNISLVLGPVMVALLYVVLWIPLISWTVKIAVGAPILLMAILFSIAWARLKNSPGGKISYPHGDHRGGLKRFFDAVIGNRSRPSEDDLELEVSRIREVRKHKLNDAKIKISVRRVSYKEDAYRDVDGLRTESTHYRRINSFFQSIVIIGSLVATGAAGISFQYPTIRWALLCVTFLVGFSSGFTGYFKFKERSFYLQQTADAIEQECEAFEVGVGRYANLDEDEALGLFVEEVHRLKSEQKKRQQNLDQPPDSRDSAE